MKTKFSHWLMLTCFFFVATLAFAETTRRDTLRIEAESAAFVQGLDYNGSTNEKIRINGTVVERIWHTNYLVYRNVDFGHSTDKIIIRKEIPRGSKVEFWINASPQTGNYNRVETTGATNIAELVIDPANYGGSGWSKWAEAEIPVSVPVSGIHDLTIVFSAGGGSASNQQFGGFDWFELNRELLNIESISPEAVYLAEKMTVKPELNLIPAAAYTGDLVYTITSGNENISLSENGNITGLQAGTAQVAVTSLSDITLNATINVTVEERTTVGDVLRIEAETAALLYGSYWYDSRITTGNTETGSSGIISIWNTNYIEYKEVDFGNYTNKISIRKNLPRPSKAEFWIDGFKTLLGTVEFTAETTMNYNVWNTYELPVSGASGIHDLQIAFFPAGSTATNQQFGGLNWLELNREFVSPELISSHDITIEKNQTETLLFTVTPSYSFQNLILSIENGNGVIELNDGVVKGIKQGTAQIKATSEINSSVSTVINVTVYTPAVVFPIVLEAENADEKQYTEISDRAGFSDGKGIGGQDPYGSYLRYYIDGISVAGTYELTVDYSDMQNRSFSLKVNDQFPVIVNCTQQSSDWNIADASAAVKIYLDAGDNVIEIGAYDHGAMQHLPVLDKLTITETEERIYKPSDAIFLLREAEDYDSGNYEKRDYIAFSSGKGIGGENKEANYTVVVPETGVYDILVYYATAAERSFFLKVNEEERVVYTAQNTGSWGDTAPAPDAVKPNVYRARFHVTLNQGGNTIQIGHDGAINTQYAPNIDKFEIVKYGSYEVDLTPQLKTWTGAEDSDWTKPANWDNGRPIAIDNIIIPAVANLPILPTATTAHSITFEAGAGADLDGTLTVTEAIRAEFEIVPDKWYSVGFPFAVHSVSGGNQELIRDANFSLKELNNGQFTAATTIDAGKGYIIRFSNVNEETTTVTFASEAISAFENGTLNVGDDYRLVANPTLNSLTVNADGNDYYYFFDAGDNKYKLIEEATVLNPFESLIILSAESGVQPVAEIAIETTQTGIADGKNDPVLSVRYYNLQGLEVKTPLENKIYIVKKIHASQKEEIVKVVY
jgi:hypothetical protein